jgi:hypothetical protein
MLAHRGRIRSVNAALPTKRNSVLEDQIPISVGRAVFDQETLPQMTETNRYPKNPGSFRAGDLPEAGHQVAFSLLDAHASS